MCNHGTRLFACLIVLSVLQGHATGQDTAQHAITTSVPADSLLEKSIGMYTEGSYEQAIETLLQLSDSTSDKRNFYLGMSYSAMNDYENAVVYLRRAVSHDSATASRRFQLGRALEQNGALKDAQTEYSNVIRFNPEYFPAFFQMGLLLYEQREFEQAAWFFKHAIRLKPRDFLSCYYSGMCYVAEGKNDSARAFLSACISLNPKYLPAITALAGIQYGDANYTDALRLYKMGSLLRSNLYEIYFRIALCYQHLNSHPEAIASFLKAIQGDSLNGACWGQLGFSFFKEQNYSHAVPAYRKAVEIDKENPLYYYNLALALEKMDSTEKSVATFYQALGAYHPENIANIYLQLGTLYYLKKEYRSALSAYRHALEYRPEDKIAQYYIALAYDQLHDSANAVRQYQKFITLARDDSAQLENSQQARHRLRYLKRQ